MKISLKTPNAEKTRTFQKIANFYVGRIQDHVDSIDICISEISQINHDSYYILRIKAIDKQSHSIQIREVQLNFSVATNRIFTRLMGIVNRQQLIARKTKLSL